MENGSPRPPRPVPALDLDFLPRVYRTSLVVAVLVGVFIWEGAGSRSAFGWWAGTALSLLGILGTEAAVRRFITPEAGSTRGLLGASCLKLFLLGGLVIAVFWLALRGWINPLWTLPGFALPHLVILLKLAGRRVLAMTRPAPGRDPD